MKPATSNIISSTARSELTLSGAPLVLRESPRARRLRLRVDPRTGAVTLTVPPRMSHRRALAWAEGHREWVERALAAVPQSVPLVPESVVPLYGLPHRIDWDPARPRRIERGEGRLLVGGPIEAVQGRIIRWLKTHALDLLGRETAEFAHLAGVTVARVGVGDPVSRWGSCSASGAIRYSWRLILAPEFVRRATVAHEVAHRVHLNHGAAFHALVAELLGADPAPARAWLRREGAALHRYGIK
jgi:predicted metal-dependent hydrolase